MIFTQTSFLIDERGGDDNAGYVSAGYFGGKPQHPTVIRLLTCFLVQGLTLGRVALIPISNWLGPHMSIWL